MLSQSMVLEHMKEGDESRVREHGCVLLSTPTKPTSIGTFILSLRSSGSAAAQQGLRSGTRTLISTNLF